MTPEPSATYRLQLRPDFGFEEAAALVPYLAGLGISHLYLSPVLQASHGSLHGYDVCDPQRLSDDLGGAPGFDSLHAALAAFGLRLMLDIVPNHMAVLGRQNRWWWDLLKHGRHSRHAAYFDVDWQADEERWPGQVLLPLLSDHYGRVLDAGGLRLAYEEGEAVLLAEGQAFPLDPGTLEEGLKKGDLAGELARAALNQDKAALHALLGRQHYRLGLWRSEQRDLGYRRFFDVKELVGLRTEDPEVFGASHGLALAMLADGRAHALRVDHPDGLRDPVQYFQRLRLAAPKAWIVAEKILAPGETLPPDWPIQGSTGYDFAAMVDGLFVDPQGEEPLRAFFETFTAQRLPYRDLERKSRQEALEELLASEVHRLGQLFLQVCERHPRHRDHLAQDLRQALTLCAVQFPVYRSYARVAEDGSAQVSELDQQRIRGAVRAAFQSAPGLDVELYQFLEELLCLRWPSGPELDLALRFQQLCGAAMAKGVEDTAFYRYRPLPCLSEVGADPEIFGRDMAAFHAHNLRAQKDQPYTLLAGSTHDSKRSEDSQARLALLSECPEDWNAAVKKWSIHNEGQHHQGWPDRLMEISFYQDLFAAWPITPARLEEALLKSAREAKQWTSWKDKNAAYEKGLQNFLQGVLGDAGFMTQMAAFVERLQGPGRLNSLSQCLLRLCSPGVPDIYQGCEAWRLSLMDPDNRRPVDFPALQEACGGLEEAPDFQRDEQGLCKLWLIKQALKLRRRQSRCFGAQGSYAPLQAEGALSGHVVAFQRGQNCLAVAPRLVLGLQGGWQDTRLPLPAGLWRNVLDGREGFSGGLALSDLLERFPVALLERQEAPCL